MRTELRSHDKQVLLLIPVWFENCTEFTTSTSYPRTLVKKEKGWLQQFHSQITYSLGLREGFSLIPKHRNGLVSRASRIFLYFQWEEHSLLPLEIKKIRLARETRNGLVFWVIFLARCFVARVPAKSGTTPRVASFPDSKTRTLKLCRRGEPGIFLMWKVLKVGGKYIFAFRESLGTRLSQGARPMQRQKVWEWD